MLRQTAAKNRSSVDPTLNRTWLFTVARRRSTFRYEEALSDVKSAIAYHLENFGPDLLEDDEQVLEAFVAETRIAA
ncbi:hypothetical protein [Lamprobacter modestohalophilus]|uniref:hypothetical protein n=1 Tax=Lamprobacter modestohalophilus TaxID=1064514 RepID=UPI0019064B00|nr:hypothetical protein [Lamprobacter modestohalophilus]